MDEATLPVRYIAVGVVRHRWKLLTALVLLGVLGAISYSVTRTQRYTATVEFVLGSQDYSGVIATSLNLKQTRPLTLDLPANTQARVIVSSIIGDRVASSLNLTPAVAVALSNSARSTAVTDNAFSISVDGATGALAARYANAYATEFFAYHQGSARAVLDPLAAQVRAQADIATSQATALDGAISQATANQRDVVALRTSRRQLLTQARNQGLAADQLEAATRSFNGSGTVTVPATAASATKSPQLVRDAVFGALLGLLVGLLAAVVAEKTSDRLYTRDDVARAAGAPVLVSLPRRGRRGWREPYQRQAELMLLSLREDPRIGPGGCIVVRPVHRSEASATLALALGEALSRSTGGSVVRPFDDRAAPALSAARRMWGGNQSVAEPPWPSRAFVTTTLEGELLPAAPVVELTVPHAADEGPSAWPPAGTVVLLVVATQHDKKPEVRRVAQELAMAGIVVLGVAIDAVDPSDTTTGWIDTDGKHPPLRDSDLSTVEGSLSVTSQWP